MTAPTPPEARGRRAVVRQLTAWCFFGLASWTSTARAARRQGVTCANPDALTPAARRQRELDNYTEASPDPHATCSVCRFFTAAGAPAACGTCQLFRGPANPQGRCDDWTAADQRQPSTGHLAGRPR